MNPIDGIKSCLVLQIDLFRFRYIILDEAVQFLVNCTHIIFGAECLPDPEKINLGGIIMRSKRMLTLLLAVCMLLTAIAPAAGAVQVGESGQVSQILRPDAAAVPSERIDGPKGSLNLRDNPFAEETHETAGENPDNRAC